MYGTPWSDGVGGVSQRPIKPGESFRHKWTATQYGSYWYHAHEKIQMEDGLMGAIVIHPRKDIPKPFAWISTDSKAQAAMIRAEQKVTPLLLSDFRHTTSIETWDITLKAGFELPCFDSVLINGMGSARCRSADEITSLLSPEQVFFLQTFNSSMTDKA